MITKQAKWGSLLQGRGRECWEGPQEGLGRSRLFLFPHAAVPWVCTLGGFFKPFNYIPCAFLMCDKIHTKMIFKRNKTMRRVANHSWEGEKKESRIKEGGRKEPLRLPWDKARERTLEAEWPGRDLENAWSEVLIALQERLWCKILFHLFHEVVWEVGTAFCS